MVDNIVEFDADIAVNEPPHEDYFNMMHALKNAELNRENTFLTRTPNKPYKYADLQSVLRVKETMEEHNFIFEMWFSYEEPHAIGVPPTQIINFQLIHKTFGPYGRASKIHLDNDKIKGQNYWQGLGSSITYLRRYIIGTCLAIGVEEDPDGEGTTGTSSEDPVNEPQIDSSTPKPSARGKPPTAPDFEV